MVYVKKWVEFHAKSVELFTSSPERTRYLIKATPSQQWLILKVTNDDVCLKFRGRSAIVINRFESFTREMLALMAGVHVPSTSWTASATGVQGMDIDGEGGGVSLNGKGTTNGTTTTIAPQPPSQSSNAAAGGGGGGKKKKKKGKK